VLNARRHRGGDHWRHEIEWVQILCDGVNMIDSNDLAVEEPVSGSVAEV
jgi:hypothetical protein